MSTNKFFIAHRGESFDAPENTLASVNLAWERGAEAVEIDVHMSKDNEIMVIHDADTKRVSGIYKKIKKSSAAELKKLEVGSWKNEKYNGERIPLLKEVLFTIPNGKKIIIEIKSGRKMLPFLKAELVKSDLRPEQIEIISFNYRTVKEAKIMMPKFNVLYLADLDYTKYTKLVSPSVEKLITMAKRANLEGLNVWAGKMLNQSFADKVRSAGLTLYVWTVNDPEHAKELISWGINGITTDRAEWMKKQL